MKLIKNVERQTRVVRELNPKIPGEYKNAEIQDPKDETKKINKEIFLNNVIDFFDHNGRVRHMTEDELRRFSKNLNEVIKEFDQMEVGK